MKTALHFEARLPRPGEVITINPDPQHQREVLFVRDDVGALYMVDERLSSRSARRYRLSLVPRVHGGQPRRPELPTDIITSPSLHILRAEINDRGLAA